MRIDYVRPAVLSTIRKPRNRNEKSVESRLISAVGRAGVAHTNAALAVGCRVGDEADVVQFDWDSSGGRGDTGFVTRVDTSESGVAIYFAGHTKDGNYSSVDETLANAGGTVSYWSVK